MAEEMVLAFDGGRSHRLLVIPALFDEAGKMRRQTVEVMHRLNLSGIDSFLPDLPGCNESRQPLDKQSLAGWRNSAQAAADEFGATCVLTLRAGALLAPAQLPGWKYAPLTGVKALRALMMAQSISAKEAGRASEQNEGLDSLAAAGRIGGVRLAGWHIGAELFSGLEQAVALPDSQQAIIDQDDIGGSGLWMRAEPGENPEQADALAAIIAIGLIGQ